jgi:hypothetical protein
MPWAALQHLLAVPHDMLDKKHAALAISKAMKNNNTLCDMPPLNLGDG